MSRDVINVRKPPALVVPNGTTRYGLVIGIDKYDDVQLNLRCAVADARVLYELMIDTECGCFPRENVQILLDSEATTDGIFRALARLRRQVAENDAVWVYYAGHAAVDDNAYWVTHDTDVDDLFATALDSNRINSVLSQLRTPNVVLILDCCHAGATALVKNQTRAIATGKDLFSRFLGHGRITLASSDGKQKSVELAEFGHGAFTYFLEKGLRGDADVDNDGVVTADELWSYLRSKVTEASGRVGIRQTPILSGSMTHDVALTLNATVTAKKHRLMKEIERFVGLRADQLTTDEGRLCQKLVLQGARTAAQRSLLESIEELIDGTLTAPQLRRVMPITHASAAALIGPTSPAPRRHHILIVSAILAVVALSVGGIWLLISTSMLLTGKRVPSDTATGSPYSLSPDAYLAPPDTATTKSILPPSDIDSSNPARRRDDAMDAPTAPIDELVKQPRRQLHPAPRTGVTDGPPTCDRTVDSDCDGIPDVRLRQP